MPLDARAARRGPRKDAADHLAGQAMYGAFAMVADPLEYAELVVINNGELSTVEEVWRYLEVTIRRTDDRLNRR